MSQTRHHLYHFLCIGVLLLTATSVAAHPVIVPNETVSLASTLIELLRVVSLALTAGWMAYSLLDTETTTISRWWYAAAWALALLSLWGDLALDWAYANELLIDSSFFSFGPEDVSFMLQSDRAGFWWLRIAGTVLLAAPLLKILPFTQWLAILGGAVVAVVSSWTAAANPTIFSASLQTDITAGAQLGQIAGQALHLYLAALWFGGLIVALVTTLGREATATISARTFLHYTQFCLAAIVVTGITLAWVRVGSVAALLQTGYGWLTLLKAGVVVGLMTLGMRWTRQNSSLRPLIIQSGLLITALIASGMLTTLDSARSVFEWRTDEYFHSFDNSFYDVRIERPLEIDLIVIPGLTGENRVIVTLIDSEVGSRLDDAQDVVVTLSGVQASATDTSLTLEPAGDGNYIGVTTLSAAGDWLATVDVNRQEIARSADFTFTLNVPPPDLPNLLSVEEPETFSTLDRVVSGTGGVLLIVLGLSEFARWRRRSNSHPIIRVLSVLCALIGLTLLIASVL
jgi:putative copper export protein